MFIHGSRLPQRLADAAAGQTPLQLLEVGLGTGLNFRATAALAHTLNAPLHYCAFEPYPPSTEALDALDYQSLFHDPHWQQAIHHLYQTTAPHGEQSQQHESTRLHLRRQHAEHSTLVPEQFDVIYLDAFSPKNCPELWQEAFLARLAKALKSGGCLCTYAARGPLKKALTHAGLHVEQPKGPPGKREYTRATKAY